MTFTFKDYLIEDQNNTGIVAEIVTDNLDLSAEDMDAMVADHGWRKVTDESTAGMHRGWIEHAPQNDFTFNTLAAAKRSARKYWNADNNQYAIIYTTSEQGVSADVTQVRPIT